MSAPAKKRAVQPSERKGNASDDQEDKTDEMVINVEFEGRNPESSDFHGIKQLLQQLFLKAQVNLSEMASYLIQQQGIGSVIKQVVDDDNDDDDDDDDEVDPNQVFGITTVFSLTEQDCESVEQLNKLLLTLGKEHSDETTFQFIGKLLNEKNRPVALLINERYVNIPPPISVPLFQSISKEMAKAGLKKNQTDDSTYFIMICKLYKLKHRNKGNKKNETEIIWSNAEEELFDEEAEYKFEFCVHGEKGSGLAGSWETDDDEMIPYRRVLFFPAQKLDFIVNKIQSLLYGA